MKIMLADGHPLFRDGVRCLLERRGHRVFTLENNCCEAVLAYLRQTDDWDVLLLSLMLRGEECLGDYWAVVRHEPRVPVAVISGSHSRGDIEHVFNAGGRGYIPRSFSGAQMLEAVERVAAGEIFIPPQEEENLLDKFSTRQLDVVMLLRKGMGNKCIASELGIGETTVKHYVSDILRVLGAENRVQAVLKLEALLEE